ncbi:ABC transporter permease [Clostridia bacterium]|nr:ABC transporter permease [Clostridia bacterium]
MRFELKMATRFLQASKGQTVFILMGIAIGVSVQIFLGTLITGLQENLIDATVGNSPHITITNESSQQSEYDLLDRNDNDYRSEISFEKTDENLFEWERIVDYLDKKDKLSAVSPVLNANGSIIKGNLRSPLVVRGIKSERANMIYDFESSMKQGDYSLESNKALIGDGLAEKYALSTGDSFTLTVANGRNENFIVEGIFSLGQKAIDESWMFVDLARAQKLVDDTGYISSIEIQVFDVFEADTIASELDQQMIDVELSNWKVENKSLLSALQSQSSSSYTIQFFVLLAITLGIASVLSVSVVQKQRQIGILKAMGASAKSARNIFILQGLILGLIGSALGALMGYLLIQGFLYGTAFATGEPLFPLTIRFGQTMIILSITTIASLISAIIPANKSSRLDPVDVMKG